MGCGGNIGGVKRGERRGGIRWRERKRRSECTIRVGVGFR